MSDGHKQFGCRMDWAGGGNRQKRQTHGTGAGRPTGGQGAGNLARVVEDAAREAERDLRPPRTQLIAAAARTIITKTPCLGQHYVSAPARCNKQRHRRRG